MTNGRTDGQTERPLAIARSNMSATNRIIQIRCRPRKTYGRGKTCCQPYNAVFVKCGAIISTSTLIYQRSWTVSVVSSPTNCIPKRNKNWLTVSLSLTLTLVDISMSGSSSAGFPRLFDVYLFVFVFFCTTFCNPYFLTV